MTIVRGQASKNAKLTEADVRRMRAMHRAGDTYAAIGRQHGVAAETAARICRRESWAHVPDDETTTTTTTATKDTP